MLALVLLASFILPGVVGHCCSPYVYQAVMYTAKEPNRAREVTMSHKKAKLLIKDLDTSYPIEFTLMDFGNDMQYVQTRNGGCQKFAIPEGRNKFFEQCTNNGKDVGSFTMGNGVKAVSFEFKNVNEVLHTVYSEEKCLPMVFVLHLSDGSISTSVFGNLKYTDLDDSFLDMDLSSCILAEVAG